MPKLTTQVAHASVSHRRSSEPWLIAICQRGPRPKSGSRSLEQVHSDVTAQSCILSIRRAFRFFCRAPCGTRSGAVRAPSTVKRLNKDGIITCLM